MTGAERQPEDPIPDDISALNRKLQGPKTGAHRSAMDSIIWFPRSRNLPTWSSDLVLACAILLPACLAVPEFAPCEGECSQGDASAAGIMDAACCDGSQSTASDASGGPTQSLTITVEGSGTGTVTSAPVGISCGTLCMAEFPMSIVVTLTATPSAGSTFFGWSGACTGTGPCNVVTNEDATATATFLGGAVLAAWQFGGTGDDSGAGIALDPSGNVLVTGSFQNVVDFGGGAFTSAGLTDIFVAKYSGTGAHQWSKRFGGSGDSGYEPGTAIVADSSGNVAVTGQCFFPSTDFGGGSLSCGGNGSVFLAQFTPLGVHQWSRTIGSGGNGSLGLSIASDGTNVLGAGHFCDTVNFGGGAVTATGTCDGYTARYSSNGSFLSLRQMSSEQVADRTAGVAADATSYYVIGSFGFFDPATINLGGTTLMSAGNSDIFVAKYSTAGVHQWSMRFGGPEFDYGTAIAGDGAGGVFVTGTFEGSADFDETTLTSIGGKDIFVANISAAGQLVWVNGFGGFGDDRGRAVAASAGGVVVTGSFSDTVDFGGGPVASSGASDVFVLKLTASGEYTWVQRFGGGGSDDGNGIAIDLLGNAWATGSFQGAVTFGDSSFTSQGSSDVFIVELAP